VLIKKIILDLSLVWVGNLTGLVLVCIAPLIFTFKGISHTRGLLEIRCWGHACKAGK